jgi:Spy/CpxP family protein refolding chaperone
MSPIAAMNRSTRSAVLLLVAAFLLGGVVGGAAVAFGFGPGGRSGPHGHDPERFERMLNHELRLTPTQQDSVRNILARHRQAMDSVWQDMAPRIETLRSTIRSEIARQLTPEQQEKFQRMNQRMDAERRPGAR